MNSLGKLRGKFVISGYALEDASAAFAEARERAVQDAEDDAEDLAAAAGMRL